MKRHIISSILIIILIISVTQFHAQSVGINTSSPDGSAALDVVSNSKGILIPRMNSGQRTGIASPADGLLVFDTQTESFWYYQSTGWLELSGGAFTNDGGTVRNTGNHATDDFVFGSDALPPTSAISDTLMFFDKSKGAFRVGKIFSSESWSNNNIGLYSFGAGQNAKAVGNYSISMGLSTTASGSQSVAIGTANTASGHFAFAGGTVNQASGENSTTFGNNVKSSSFLGFSLGHFNVGNFSSANTWILTDPLFEIGNGTSSTNLSNALTVLKNGDFIVGKEITPPSTAITDTMMFFDKSKGAFRSGSIFNSNVWSDVALGKFSFASGLNTRAFGVSSSAFGDGAVAEGQASFAGGVGSIAVELGSFAFGGGTVALENYATAFGNSTKANEASSTALGFFTIANGVNSTSMGQSTRSQARSSTALGMYNVGIGDVSLIIPADPIFEVGIGTSEATRKNALTVTKAGDVLFKNHFAPIQGTNYSGATFYFNNAKTALRMGNLHEAASWSDSIGLYSLGIGNRTVAKGFASIALGNENTALGTGSVALGWKAIARSSASIAFGQYVNSPSKAAISLGSYNVGLGVDDNIWHDNDPILEVGIGQSEATRQNAMTILKNGYVGIGNSAPDALVHIEKSSTLSDPQILINEIGYDYARLTMKNDQYTSFWTLASRPNDTPADSRFNIFNSDGGDILSLQGDGDAIISERLVVGATAPLAALHANSNMGEDALRIQSNGATKMRVYENGSISLGGNYGDPAPTGSADDVFVMNQMGMGVSNPTFRLQIENNADLIVGHARATAWTTYSDARVKDNVKNIPYGLKEVMALRPVQYDHHSSSFDADGLKVKDDYSHEIGFIAQEVYNIVSEIVDKPSDESNDLWSMDYEKLTPVLVKAIQEQQKQISNYELRMGNYESEIESLKAQVSEIKTLKAQVAEILRKGERQ